MALAHLSANKKEILCIRLFIFSTALFSCLLHHATAGETPPDKVENKPVAKYTSTGFFKTFYDNGRWWLLTPEGSRFYSIAACSIHPYGDHAPALGYNPYHRNILKLYGNEDAWATATTSRLLDWGFNSKGAWSSSHVKLPDFRILNFSGGHWLKGALPDFFSKDFADTAEKVARENTTPDDPNLIAYFLDNEMQWETDWRLGKPIFDQYAALPADAAGKQAMAEFFKKRYDSTAKMARVWQPSLNDWDAFGSVTEFKSVPGMEEHALTDREAFTLHVAQQYFRVTTESIRRHDPNHIIAGCRFVSWATPIVVVAACGQYCDIVSLNHYELGPLGEAAYGLKKRAVRLIGGDLGFDIVYQLARKPLLITEFSFRSADSGLPNTHPPGMFVQPVVPTQAVRAEKYRHFVTTWAGRPFFVGHHWFKYMDEPKEGRFDGENGNYGLVDINDKPYETFVAAVREINGRLAEIHAHSAPSSMLDAALMSFQQMHSWDRARLNAVIAAAAREESDPATIFAASLALAAKDDASLVSRNEKGGVLLLLRTFEPKETKLAENKTLNAIHKETLAIARSDVRFIGVGVPGILFEARADASGDEVVLSVFR